MVRACSCQKVLWLASDAFADRIRGWRRIHERRRNVRVHVICPDCGQVWRMSFDKVDGTDEGERKVSA
jgi:RNase P subunit RPR2